MNKFVAVTSLLLFVCIGFIAGTTPATAMSKEKARAECAAMYRSMGRYPSPDAMERCVADKMRK